MLRFPLPLPHPLPASRDLKNLGLTEAQIHEVIPDASAAKKRGGGGTGEK